jgi:hypothetical protein
MTMTACTFKNSSPILIGYVLLSETRRPQRYMVGRYFFCLLVVWACTSCKSNKCDISNIRNKRWSEINECFENIIGDKQFFLGKRTDLYEYQNSLLDLVKDVPAGDSILVREISVRDGNNKIVVWLKREEGEWIIVDRLNIPPNVEY